ncbi:MAG: hypothetical protein IPO21_20965 [Bacteroidales bacterium]|nr:hypothetical protein [Bacteroidales bacterium]
MRKIIILLVFICSGIAIQAQDTLKKFTFDGYTSFMQTVITDSLWMTQSMFHNRLNFNWYPIKVLKVNLEVRNRFVYGEMVTMDYAFGEKLSFEDRPIDLSHNWFSKPSWVLNSMVDRGNVELTLNKFQLTLGRQRINWARTFVWNPNDIFNSYSYFDFDYSERIGVDAIRAVLYTGVSSQVELVASLGKDTSVKYAGLYKFNVFNYDIQVLGSFENNSDWTAGLGFEGFIKSVSLRGEANYYKPIDSVGFMHDAFLGSIGIDKIFKHDFSVQLEFMYNSQGKKLPKSLVQYIDLNELYSTPITAKNPSFDRFNLFVNISKPITPLVSTSLAWMYYIENNMFFVSPNVSVSLKENLSLSFVGQFFSVAAEKERVNVLMFFGRLKHSF